MSQTLSLGQRLAEEIKATGPISLATYMQRALTDPDGGYYMARDPFGQEGDFTTAPEVSQMFGEMIGLWCAQRWLDFGRPSPIHVVELGPGRGTLQSDFQRATRQALPDFWRSAHVHMIEASPVLRQKQGEALKDQTANAPAWHDDISTVPDGPFFLIANEFFDALPIRQFTKQDGTWYERMVTLDAEDEFAFALSQEPLADISLMPEPMRLASDGTIAEVCEAAQYWTKKIAVRLCKVQGQALVVDYGYVGSRPGDTFQAVRNHEFADPLREPGTADLTAHVDFATLANAATAQGAHSSPILTQSEFLRNIGIEARTQQLMNNAAEPQRQDLGSELKRLIDPDEMGVLFKVLAISSPGLPPPPGFTLY